jgi:hypothetical protein
VAEASRCQDKKDVSAGVKRINKHFHIHLQSLQSDSATMDLNDQLDIIGQQPLLNIYTQVCFCYPVDNASLHSAIIDTLTSGLERLTASFPWVAGKVVNEGASEGNTGIFKIKPFEQIPRLVVKNLSENPAVPTMDNLRRANFPFRMLDEALIAPRRTLPGNPDESASESPVFLLQANFITGGLLLTIVGQHNAMDMTGQGQIIHLLSKACRNEQFTREELSSGNLVRHKLIPLLGDSYKQGPEIAHQIVDPNPSPPISKEVSGDAAPIAPPKATWAYFTFQPTSLAILKAIATESITPPCRYISTDDTLTAMIWQSVVRARTPRFESPTKSTLARAVDVRPYLNIPKTYPGLVQNMTYHTYPFHKMVEEPLGSVASNLRLALDPETSTLAYDTRALATYLSCTLDKTPVSVTAKLDLSSGLMLSSWTRLNCYHLDFNLGLGKPESVRRPQFTPVESLIYLMPKTLDGEIAVAVCLRDEDLERLKADEEFAKYAHYIE